MTQGPPDWQTLARHVEPEWSAARHRKVRQSIDDGRARRRTQLYVGTVAAAAMAVAALGVGLWHEPGRKAVPAAVPSQTPGNALDKAVHAVVTPLSEGTKFETTRTAGASTYHLMSGSARFDVRDGEVTVLARDVVIEHIGTVFDVALLVDERVKLTVHEGAVHASYPDGEVTLEAPNEMLLPPPSEPSRPQSAQSDGGAEGNEAATAAPRARRWVALAREGNYQQAYRALSAAGADNVVQDETGELMLAADAARLSGHPEQAVPYLRRVLVSHSGDPRAPLAAFTLGRVLLDELGQPRAAARAFARATTGPLAEDALARQVEAHSRAGDAARARELARQYERKFPQGRRLEAVHSFGGIDVAVPEKD